MYVSQYPRAIGLKIPEDAKEEGPIELTESIHTFAHTPYLLKMTYGSSDNGNTMPIVVNVQMQCFIFTFLICSVLV